MSTNDRPQKPKLPPVPLPQTPAADTDQNDEMTTWPTAQVLTPMPWPFVQPMNPSPVPPSVSPPVPVPSFPSPQKSSAQSDPLFQLPKASSDSSIKLPSTTDAKSFESTAITFAPTRRPPVPVLCVFDDGHSNGELIRIRGFSFVIGRTEGNLQLTTDSLCSKKHAMIAYEKTPEGVGQWVVTDLDSLHGTYLRLRRTTLSHQTEILVGNGRYRMEIPIDDSEEETEDPQQLSEVANTTFGRYTPPAITRPPLILRELSFDQPDKTYPLGGNEMWIGSDPRCEIYRHNDPFTSPRHVKLVRDQRNIWSAENNKTDNGLWVRVPRFVVKSECVFQIGEQRFRIVIPSNG